MRAPNPAAPRLIHDLTAGSLSGFTAGFVAGLFLLRLVDHIAVPFASAFAGAVLGARLLVRHGGKRSGVTLGRVLAWVVFVLATTFLVLLYAALADLQ